MQTIEKALHQPMPFTTGGQTISDRLTAAKHSLAGSQLGKTICKATTEEIMAPKKKHLDYLLHCTNEPNVSIPSMANLLIERTQHPNWTVVYKALITIHNIMCYGNERFSQYLASCNTTFNLGQFLDKGSASGYDMSNHVRRYGKYIGEKIATYRTCAFDFCKVKRGREDGLLRTMHTDKLLKTIPILQNQIDALLEFQVSTSELNNGVISCSFILLFRDLIRLFACYNDGIINVLEKYFDMNKKQARESLDTYKAFLTRLDKVAEFLRVAESVGIEKSEIPDLTRAPASLLEALEAHLIHLEGGKAPPTSAISQQSHVPNFYAQKPIAENEKQKYLEIEQERLRQFEEQRKVSAANPFAADVGTSSSATTAQPQPAANKDLLDFFQAAATSAPPAADTTNPFANFGAPATAPAPAYQPSSAHPFGPPPTQAPVYGNIGTEENPFLTHVAPTGAAPPPPHPPPPTAHHHPQGPTHPPPPNAFHHAAPPVPPPPPASAVAAAHHQQQPINPFAEQPHDFQSGYGAPPSVDNITNMTHQMSLAGAPQGWNGAPAAPTNPFGAPPAAPMYAQQPYPMQSYQAQPPMWNPQMGYSPFGYPQPGQMSYEQQQQQVQLVHQAAAAQQHAQHQQAQQIAKDPFS